MKAIVKTANGADSWETEVPKLKTNNDVIIKVLQAGVCRTDMFVAQNKIPVTEGRILGHEFSGIIENIGAKVDRLLLGSRVGVMPVLKKNKFNTEMLGIDLDGAFADYVLVPASNVYPVPDTMSAQEISFLEPVAACLSVIKAPIFPEQMGLIYGKNRFAFLIDRILKLKGFKFIDIIDDNEEIHEENFYDFIIETIPTSRAFARMINLLRPSGLLILKSRPHHSTPVSIHDIVKKEIQLQGTYYGDFQESIEILASGDLEVSDLFGNTFSFTDAIPILSGKIDMFEDKKIFIDPNL